MSQGQKFAMLRKDRVTVTIGTREFKGWVEDPAGPSSLRGSTRPAGPGLLFGRARPEGGPTPDLGLDLAIRHAPKGRGSSLRIRARRSTPMGRPPRSARETEAVVPVADARLVPVAVGRAGLSGCCCSCRPEGRGQLARARENGWSRKRRTRSVWVSACRAWPIQLRIRGPTSRRVMAPRANVRRIAPVGGESRGRSPWPAIDGSGRRESPGTRSPGSSER